MTALEAYKQKVQSNPTKRKFTNFDEIVENFCPAKFGLGRDFKDEKVDFKYVGYTQIIGCRGISCQECWNLEME